MSNITVPTKSPGDQHTAAELNQQTGWINSPMQNLGAFNPAMVFDSQGQYDKYTLTTNITLSATGIVDGQVRILWIETDGIHNITLGAGFSGGITDLANVIAAGTYLFMFASFIDENGVSKVLLNAPNVTFLTIPEPVMTALNISADNTTCSIPFNTPVYANNDATGNLQLSDFGTPTLTGGTATLPVLSNPVHVAGDAQITFDLSFTGTPDGTEILEIPVADGASIFNTLGVAMLATESATNNLNVAYTFANTHELVVDAASGEGVTVVNNNCYPSDGAGTDQDVSFEFWYETPGTIGDSKTFLVTRDDNDDTVLLTIGRGSDDSINCQFLTDVSNILKKQTASSVLSASTLHHIVLTKTGETFAGIKIYVDGVEPLYGNDLSTGTYTGMPAIVGNCEIDVGNSQGGSSGTGNYQIFRQFDIELDSTQVTFSYNSGVPRGIEPLQAPALHAACQQENLLNNNPNADNIGVNGTNQGGVTYQAV
jgi:hypothetical protein